MLSDYSLIAIRRKTSTTVRLIVIERKLYDKNVHYYRSLFLLKVVSACASQLPVCVSDLFTCAIFISSKCNKFILKESIYHIASKITQDIIFNSGLKDFF